MGQGSQGNRGPRAKSAVRFREVSGVSWARSIGSLAAGALGSGTPTTWPRW
jgi:hypothetical protein